MLGSTWEACAQAGKSTITSLLVPVGALHPLVAFLRLEAEGGDGTGLEPGDADRLVGLLAVAVDPGLDPLQGLVDLGDQLARPVAGAELQGASGFGRGAVGNVGLVQAALLQMVQGFRRFVEEFVAPCQELAGGSSRASAGS